MSGITITAIIPAHPDQNRASLRERAISSVHAQTHKVDAIAVVHGHTNTVAKNKAAREAVTDWLGFLDDDDYWVPTAVEVVLKYVDSADCVIGNMDTLPGWQLTHEQRLRLLKSGCVFVGSSGLFIKRATFLSLGGFDESLVTGDIFDFMLRVHTQSVAVTHTPDVVYHKEITSGITHTKSLNELQAEQARILESYFS